MIKKIIDFFNKKLVREKASTKNIKKNWGRYKKIMIGSGSITQRGFLSTDIQTLDIRLDNDWKKIFKINSISNVLAEHVFEHLTEEETSIAFKNIYRYLKQGGRLRIAVPDKNRPDEKYQQSIRPPSDGHKSLYDVEILTTLLKKVGFFVQPLEYYDKSGNFYKTQWKVKDGFVRRSAKYDQQKKFKFNGHYYTSLIVDAIKK